MRVLKPPSWETIHQVSVKGLRIRGCVMQRTSHDSACNNEGSKVGGHAVELLELPPERLVCNDLRFDLDGPDETVHLGLELLLGGAGVDLGNDLAGLLDLAVGNELSGRLGALGEEAGEDDGRDTADGNHDSPAVSSIGQGGTEGVGNKLAESDAEVVEGNHAASVFRGSKFTNVEGLYVLEWRIVAGE